MSPSRKRKRLLKRFDKLAILLRRELIEHYGESSTETLVPRVRKAFDDLIPTIPDVGGRPPFTLFINSTVMFLAMYREMRKDGHSVDEVGNLIYALTEHYIDSLSGTLKFALSHLMFSNFYINRARRRARDSRSARLVEGFQYDFVEGTGRTFDYGIDYRGCAVVKYLTKQRALELAPYICRLDIIYSETFNWGLVRTTTIANGFERCDFRFKQGGPTQVTTDYR